MLLTPLMPNMATYRHIWCPEMARNRPLNGTLFRGGFEHYNTTISVVFGYKPAPMDHIWTHFGPGPVHKCSKRGPFLAWVLTPLMPSMHSYRHIRGPWNRPSPGRGHKSTLFDTFKHLNRDIRVRGCQFHPFRDIITT